MADEHVLFREFEIKGGDFGNAGKTSTTIKEILREIGIDPSIMTRACIAAYEAEMNVVMYARRATLTMIVSPKELVLRFEDEGQGIADISKAMQEGFSTATDEMREMGFGAGMGLPNIKRNADHLDISSTPGEGTFLNLTFLLNKNGAT